MFLASGNESRLKHQNEGQVNVAERQRVFVVRDLCPLVLLRSTRIFARANNANLRRWVAYAHKLFIRISVFAEVARLKMY